MTKLERLLNLTAALLATERPLPVDELRVRLEGYSDSDDAFRRAFERDKESLRLMGIPISVEPIHGTDPPGSGYRIHPGDYGGVDPQLEPDELAALHLAATKVRLEGIDGAGVMQTLGGGSVEGDDEVLAELPAHDELGPLFEATRAKRQVEFRYGDTVRRVEPWHLSFHRGHWYINGWDHVREAERLYRVDRFASEVTVGGPAVVDRPERPSSNAARRPAWEMGDDEPVEATIRIDPDLSMWARAHLGPDAEVIEHADGSIDATLSVRNVEAFRSFVLTFLDRAEVLAPPELRTDLIEWLEAQT